MSPYIYRKLHNGEIRLVTLHPGESPDRITLSVSHVLLAPSEPPRRPSLKDIRKTLPPNWKVFEEISGQLCFYQEKDEGECESQWNHPDPAFEAHLREINRQARGKEIGRASCRERV